MSELKRLSPQQSRRVNALIRKECCNCFDGNCILLDDGESCVCPQLISYSLLCKWFRAAVLPLDKLLFAELYQSEDKRRCSVCGAAFASTSNNVKYCPDCRKYITRNGYPFPMLATKLYPPYFLHHRKMKIAKVKRKNATNIIRLLRFNPC